MFRKDITSLYITNVYTGSSLKVALILNVGGFIYVVKISRISFSLFGNIGK